MPTGDLADCLLLAYEHIADIAQDSAEIAAVFDKSRTTLTLEERIAARRHLLPDMEFDVTETAESFYVLATVPGFTSGQIDIGLDPNWVAIFAHRDARAEIDEASVRSRGDRQILRAHLRTRTSVTAKPNDRDGAGVSENSCAEHENGANCCREHVKNHSQQFVEHVPAETKSCDASREPKSCAGPGPRAGNHGGETVSPAGVKLLPDRLFGARELTQPIDPDRATAVVSNGLLALKLPKSPIP